MSDRHADARRARGRSILLACCGLIATLAAAAAPARAQTTPAPVVVVVPIHGEISDSMVATLKRAIRRAEDQQAAFLLIDIDTPGGSVTTMETLAEQLDRSKVPPVAYVTHEALSAGAYLALTCTHIYTNDQAQIGSSMPIFMVPGLGVIPPEIDEGLKDLMEKQLSALRSKFRNRAEQHRRPGIPALAEAMVDPKVEVLLVARGTEQIPMTRLEYEDARRNDPTTRVVRTIVESGTLLNLTSREAFDLGVSDGIVVSREEVLDALGVLDARVVEVWPNWSERMVGGVQGVRWWLILAGLLLIALELFFAPGTLVAGVTGALCLATVFLSNYLVGLAEVPELLLIVLGIGLLAVEVFVIPGFGAFGIAGLTCIALGLLFSFLPFLVPDSPVESELLATTLRNFALAILGTFAFVMVTSRFVVRRTPFFYRRLVLDTGVGGATVGGAGSGTDRDAAASVTPGTRGIARSDLRPAGKVEVGDRLLDARSEGSYLPRGAAVEIVSNEGSHVVVRLAGGGRARSPV